VTGSIVPVVLDRPGTPRQDGANGGSMPVTAADLTVLRPLAERYAAIAHQSVQRERLERYRATNDLERPRPVVLIDEVPWGEIRDESLNLKCPGGEARAIELRLRRTLYQWDHWQVDLVVPPEFRVSKRSASTGLGLEMQEVQIAASGGSYAAAHWYVDQLATDEDLARLREPTIRFDRDATDRELNDARAVFEGLLPVRAEGGAFQWNTWDTIARYRGVGNLLLDLAARPDFMHRTVQRFTDIAISVRDQHAAQGLLDSGPVLLHCTPACTRTLPAPLGGGPARPPEVWGRGSAQIFSAVSPSMHDEFDLAYSQELFAPFGLVYYGCCEPLHDKVDLLRRRFPTLRKVSVTPWADTDTAADAIGRDFVMSAKPNPTYVAGPGFDPGPVEAEIARYLEAAKRNGATCEFVLKDISTISGNPGILTRWAETVARVIDRFF
jgi:hypothetical protein